MFFLCVLAYFVGACAYEVTTNPTSGEHPDNLDVIKNLTTTESPRNNVENKTLSTHRFSQPSQIERTLVTLPEARNGSSKEGNRNTLGNFKPSPQLETYYEYNKFPVVPALPEAKTFSGFNNDYSNGWSDKPITPSWINNKQNIQNSWLDSTRGHNSWDESPKLNVNSEQPWVSRVKFPSPSSSPANERPYAYDFVSNNEKLSNYPSVNFPATTEGFSFNKPVEKPSRSKPSVGFWEKLMGFGNRTPEPVQNKFYDYNLLEKPPHYSHPKEYEQGLSHGGNPWPKIIKILTTILPIGLLISALTPTVITVTSMNDTQSRYRAEELKHPDIANALVSSLNKANIDECEDKVLCELLVSASISKNSEQHIENLLNTFSENKDLRDKKEDLVKVFDAVRNEDCSAIVCPNIKYPT